MTACLSGSSSAHLNPLLPPRSTRCCGSSSLLRCGWVLPVLAVGVALVGVYLGYRHFKK